MREEVRTAEQKIAVIATRDHGVVARRELLDAGLSSSAIGRRVAKGALIPEYDGVYRVGHRAPSQEASYMAATKAGGPGTYIANRAAAHALGLVKGRPPKPDVVSRRELDIPGLEEHALPQPGSPGHAPLEAHPHHQPGAHTR